MPANFATQNFPAWEMGLASCSLMDLVSDAKRHNPGIQ